MHICSVIAESKLNHTHRRISRAFEELYHLVGNYAQILSHKSERRDFLFYRREKAFPRSVAPEAVFCVGSVRLYAVIIRKSYKMVKTNRVEKLRRRLCPADEKFISVIFHILPIVKRIAPLLPVLRKIVRRNARNKARTTIPVELKAPVICPHISRIRRYIYRHIAEYLYSERIDISAQTFPLGEKQILLKNIVVRSVGKQLFVFFQRRLFPADKTLGKIVPASAPELVFKRHEQRVIADVGMRCKKFIGFAFQSFSGMFICRLQHLPP